MCKPTRMSSDGTQELLGDTTRFNKAKNKKVNISKLKQWVMATLPQGSTLREVLLQEPDKLAIEGFIAKSTTWMKLARLEESSLTQHGD